MTKPKRKIANSRPGADLVAAQVGTTYVPYPKRAPSPGEAIIPEGLVIQRFPVPVGRYAVQPGEVISGGFMADWRARRSGV